MSGIDTIVREARERGIRPWIAVKELIALEAIRVLAEDDRAVLQGGAALHFAYGSPRLSVDVDYVGPNVASALLERGPSVAGAAATLLGLPARWSLGRSGRLLRGKVTLELDVARRIVLPVEAFEVPAHRAQALAGFGRVEEPVEIIADKVVACASRLAARGTFKTRDLYDLWFLLTRAAADSPSPDLVVAKAADYGEAPRGLDLELAARKVPEEELRQSLEGVLPSGELAGLDPRAILEAAAELLGRYHGLL